MAMFEKEMRHAVEFIPNRVYYVALSSNPPANIPNKHFFSIDNEMVYWNFYLDFGPLNLGHVYRYCCLMNRKLNDPKLQDKVIYHYSHTHAHKRTNAAFLICSWFMLFQNRSPEEAFRPFKSYIAPFPPWHDATPSPCTFNLTILDTLKGLYKAREHKFFDLQKFDIEEYEFYEQVENGDLNWCMDGKFLAFAGPHAERQFSPGGYHTLRPEDYLNYFKRKNVTLVVRLNKSYYDARKFTNHGIDHIDMYFLDGSNPPDHILAKFIAKCEETPGAVAVHCKAGLGRTGTCIAAYIMKHFRWTAEEIIGWLRIVRPGSVIGPQQQYLKDIQNRMWREGELMRTKLTSSHLSSSLPTVAAAKDESMEAIENGKSVKRPTSSGSGSMNHATSLPYAPTPPQSASINSAAKRLSKLSLSAGSGPSTTPNSKAHASSISQIPNANHYHGHSVTPNSLSAKTAGSSPLELKQSPVAVSSSHKAYITSSGGSSRPSSRGTNRATAVNSTTEEGDKEGSQGDLLRIRRQQHLQNSAVYSLTNTSTPPKNRLSFGFSSTEVSTSATKITYSNGSRTGTDSPQSGSNTPTASNGRPRSRLGGFLSAWNK